MREILFRGKKIDNSEWAYGNLIIDEDRRYFILSDLKKYSTKIIRKLTRKKYYYDKINVLRRVEVVPETVGQYTGVKDKNGEKIFEGDLVTFHTEYEIDNDDVWYEKEPYLVKWDNEIAGFEPFYLNGRWRCDIVNLRIVGNKWDNPELLEKIND